MSAELNSQRKNTAEAKAALESEVSTREAQEKIAMDKRQHVKDLMDS